MQFLYSLLVILNLTACKSKINQNLGSLQVFISADGVDRADQNPGNLMKFSESRIISLHLFSKQVEHSKDSHTNTEEYLLKGKSLSISKKSTGRGSKPEEKKVYTLSQEKLRKLYDNLKSKNLLKDYVKKLEVVNVGTNTETRLRVELAGGKTYNLEAYGGYKNISNDDVYINMQSIKYLLESFIKN